MSIWGRFFKRGEQGVPSGEVAVADTASSYLLKYIREYNPDVLVRRKGGFKVYDAMRQDDAIKAALYLKKQAVLASGWYMEPVTDSPGDVKVAEFVEDALNALDGTFDGFLHQVMSALDYGFSITEIVWRMVEEGPWSGKVGIQALKGKQPHTFRFERDKYGNLLPRGLVQEIMGSEVPLPIDKFVVWTYQKEFGNWYGTSDLRSAYPAWWAKDSISKFWNIYLERFGHPLTIGKYTNPDHKGLLEDVLDNIQARTSITHEEGAYDISFLEPARRSTSDYQTALEYYNRNIARSILIPDRLMAGGETGAYSQAQIHFDVFLWVVQRLRQELAESVVQEQLIKRLVRYNFANAELPRFKFNPMTDDQRVELAKIFSDAVQKGAVLPTFEDENHLRRILSFPEKNEEEELKDDTRRAPDDKRGGGVGDTEDGKTEMAQRTYRELSTAERRVDFGRIERELDQREAKVVEQLQKTLTRQRDDLIAFVTRQIKQGTLTTKLLQRGVDLKHLREIRRTLIDLLSGTYALGKADARQELPKTFAAKARPGQPVVPQRALDYLEAKADFSVRGLREPLITETHGVLLEAIRTGAPVPQVVKQLQDVYSPYLSDRTIIKDSKKLAPYRLEAIVRTTMSEAYAYGRLATAEDPDLQDFIVGYQFTEIIDDRTVEVSRFVDGKVIPKDHPSVSALTYPLHWNDRGMFTFVTKRDLPVTFMSEGDIARAISMKGYP